MVNASAAAVFLFAVWAAAPATIRTEYISSYRAVLGIRIRMFLGLPDLEPIVNGTDPALDLSLKFYQKILFSR